MEIQSGVLYSNDIYKYVLPHIIVLIFFIYFFYYQGLC